MTDSWKLDLVTFWVVWDVIRMLSKISKQVEHCCALVEPPTIQTVQDRVFNAARVLHKTGRSDFYESLANGLSIRELESSYV